MHTLVLNISEELFEKLKTTQANFNDMEKNPSTLESIAVELIEFYFSDNCIAKL